MTQDTRGYKEAQLINIFQLLFGDVNMTAIGKAVTLT